MTDAPHTDAPDDAPADPPSPRDADAVRPLLVGTVAFAIAALVLATRWSSLADDDRLWWFWTCVVGVGLGLIGLTYTVRRRAAYRAAGRDAG